MATYLRNQLKQMEEYFLNKPTQAGAYILQQSLQAVEHVHRQFRQVEDHGYDQPLQTLGSVHHELVQVAKLAYFQLTQEKEYVRLLPKLYVLERVYFQQVFVQKQVPYQLAQVARHFYLQAVEHVCCQLLQAEDRATS